MKLKSVFLFPEGQVAVCDEQGQQIADLQGVDSPALRAKIDPLITPDTELFGYPRPFQASSNTKETSYS